MFPTDLLIKRKTFLAIVFSLGSASIFDSMAVFHAMRCSSVSSFPGSTGVNFPREFSTRHMY